MSVYWVDIIGDIVEDVRGSTDKPAALTSEQPYYLYGTFNYIANYLNEMDKVPASKAKQYPLIALFMPFTETNGESMLVKSQVDLTLGFITSSNQNYTNPDRYNNSFRELLYPLYEIFLQKLIDSKRFLEIDTGLNEHEKTDLLFWGASNKNILNDKIDAIEVRNIELKLKLSNINNC